MGQSEDDVTRLFELLDADGSKRVSLEEWQSAFSDDEVKKLMGPTLHILMAAFPVPGSVTFSELAAASPTRIDKTEERAITLRQLKAIIEHIERRCEAEAWCDWNGKKLKPSTVTLYDVASYVIKPATKPHQCSYVELVASGPQPPKWFVSHWWGGRFVHFVRCLEQHAKDHGYDDNTAYWVCACANNQWNIASELDTTDLTQTSFRKALELAEGTVSVLDMQGKCFTRVWCCYEIFVSLVAGRLETTSASSPQPSALKYEVYAVSKLSGRAVGITDGPALSKYGSYNEEDEGREDVG